MEKKQKQTNNWKDSATMTTHCHNHSPQTNPRHHRRDIQDTHNQATAIIHIKQNNYEFSFFSKMINSKTKNCTAKPGPNTKLPHTATEPLHIKWTAAETIRVCPLCVCGGVGVGLEYIFLAKSPPKLLLLLKLNRC